MYKLAVVLVIAVGCTKKADQCTSNADCTDPAYPFCDVSGQFAASGGNKNVCTIVPTDCPVEVCGCQAGSATCGSDGTLAVCNADGMSVTTTMCAAGCELPAAVCRVIVPSNGLGSALQASSSESAITIPSGASINTDTGEVLDASMQPLSISSVLIAQPSGPEIRTFAGATVSVGDVTIAGSAAVAFVAYGDVVAGNISATAIGPVGGPGAVGSAACVGNSEDAGSGTEIIAFGAGGGGDATAGAFGGGRNGSGQAGGAPVLGFTMLAGGCAGGDTTFDGDPNNAPDFGGGGGGAVQLVSNSSITINGIINLGGGGGQQNSGGGAGGLVVVEAPRISLGAQGGIAANGGGGGGDCPGADATGDANPAAGGGSGSTCDSPIPALAGGSGGTLVFAPATGTIQSQELITHTMYGGGGGAVGRAHLSSLDGSFGSTGSTLISVAVTSDVVVTQ